MTRFVGFVVALMIVAILAGFVLAHSGFVVLLALGIVLVGRYLKRHGV